MRDSSELVLDIETFRDLDARIVAPMTERACAKVKKERPKAAKPKPETLQKIDAEYRAKINNAAARVVDGAALRPILGRVVSIGVGTRSSSASSWEIRAFTRLPPDKPVDGYHAERELLEEFSDFLVDHKRALFVTFNGRRFDLPFLVARAAIHRTMFQVPIPLGYSREHVDLFDVLGGDGTLEEWCLRLGLGEKPTEGGSAGIAELVEARDVAAIEDHVTFDVRATCELWDRLRANVR